MMLNLKLWLLMLAGLVAILLVHNAQDYLLGSHTEHDKKDYQSVDYYLADFSLKSVTATGFVDRTVQGTYLGHWQARNQSLIISPAITSIDPNTGEEISLRAEEALLDHQLDQLALNGAVNGTVNMVAQTVPETAPETVLQTNEMLTWQMDSAFLNYDFVTKQLTSDSKVIIKGPQLHLQGVGLEGNLNEAYLKLHETVKSTYHITP